MTRYAELHCCSNFSFLRGASHPEELVQRAHELGYQALAITDECSLAGIVRAHVAAKNVGIKLIIGSTFLFNDGTHLAVLAPCIEAYESLSRLITKSRRAADKGHYQVCLDDFIQDLSRNFLLVFSADQKTLDVLKKTFKGRIWLGVELFNNGQASRQLSSQQALSRETGIPLVACGDVHMHVRSRRALQDTLTAIRLGRTISETGFNLHPNGERYLRSQGELSALYPRALLDETVVISDQCHFSLDEFRYEYPEEIAPKGQSLTQYLRFLTFEGMKTRWPEGATQKVRKLIEHELSLICEMQYEAYFLTVYDIVHFARRRNILCQGRGSAANSAVCFCLGITEVDPARMNLLFERFISKERNEPPDIDVDFEHQRREEVVQYIYQKYGRDRAALTATVISYRLKSALRDVGKSLGLDLNQVDQLARSANWWDGETITPDRLLEVGIDPESPLIKRVMWLVRQILGFPRHLSQHVGGFVITRGLLSERVPIENASMPDRTVIQWDKDDLDALGMLKIDCLCLGMLSAIHRAFDLIKDIRGHQWEMATIPAEDPDVYRMIQKADTIGVFQIESRAQMAMLPRLRPENFYDLVIEVALVRPGPIQGDMVHPYLRRRQGLEAIDYPSDAVRAVLERTLGVPIFQEQVIQLAMVAAGFSPGEADHLRRSMAAWKRHGDIYSFESRLIEGMKQRGYDEAFAQRIFNQIKGFGEYGFPESHAASFALLVYVSAWLKRHEPAAFFCAMLNSYPLGFYAPSQLVQNAKRHAVEVRPVDVTVSDWESTLEIRAGIPQPALRLGMKRIKGLAKEKALGIVQARREMPFKNVNDLSHRAGLNSKDLRQLAQANALRLLSGHRHRAQWAVSGIETALPLFEDESEMLDEGIPMLRTPTEGENIVADYATLGLSLERHPLALIRHLLDRKTMQTAQGLCHVESGRHVNIAGLVVSRQRPGAARKVIFLTLEDETGHMNVIVWSSLAEQQKSVVLSACLLEVFGEVQREGDVLHIIAKRLHDRSDLLGRLQTKSRDFH